MIKLQAKLENLTKPEITEDLWENIEKSLDEYIYFDRDSKNIITLPTAHGRTLNERKVDDLCLNIKHNRRPSRLSG